MAQRTQVPQEAVDALQRGDLLTAFKTLRQQGGGVNLQAIGNVLEAHARQYAEQQVGARQGASRKAASNRVADAARSLETLADKANAVQHGIAQQAALHRKRPPTVQMGDAPGSLRWMLLVLALLAVAAWIVIGA